MTWDIFLTWLVFFSLKSLNFPGLPNVLLHLNYTDKKKNKAKNLKPASRYQQPLEAEMFVKPNNSKGQNTPPLNGVCQNSRPLFSMYDPTPASATQQCVLLPASPPVKEQIFFRKKAVLYFNTMLVQLQTLFPSLLLAFHCSNYFTCIYI